MPPKTPPDMQPYVPSDPRYALPEEAEQEVPKEQPPPQSAAEMPKELQPTPDLKQVEREKLAAEKKAAEEAAEAAAQRQMKFTISSAFMSGISSVLYPGRNTKRTFGQVGSIIHYYKISIIPAFIIFIFGMLLLASPTYALGTSTAIIVGSGASGPLGLFLIAIVSLMLLNPIRMIVDSRIIHFFGTKVLKDFKKDYANTMSAILYGMLPPTFLSWAPLAAVAAFFWLAIPGLFASNTYSLSQSAPYIPVVFAALFTASYLWSLIVTVFALSNQQKIKWPIALLAVCIAGMVSIVAIIMISYLLNALFGFSGQAAASFLYQFL